MASVYCIWLRWGWIHLWCRHLMHSSLQNTFFFAQNWLLIVVIFHKFEKDSFSTPTWHFHYLVGPRFYLAGVWLFIFKVSNIQHCGFSTAQLLFFCCFTFDWLNSLLLAACFCLNCTMSLATEYKRALVWFTGCTCNETTALIENLLRN